MALYRGLNVIPKSNFFINFILCFYLIHFFSYIYKTKGPRAIQYCESIIIAFVIIFWTFSYNRLVPMEIPELLMTPTGLQVNGNIDKTLFSSSVDEILPPHKSFISYSKISKEISTKELSSRLFSTEIVFPERESNVFEIKKQI